MKRRLRITTGLLGLLALGALGVTLTLTLGGSPNGPQPVSQAPQSPIQTPTQPPYPPPMTPTLPGLPATPTQAPTPMPRCTFAARSAPAAPVPSLDAYRFSEPQVVLTHTAAIGIAGWLPDSRRLLITRDVPGTNRQSIETLDIRTGEVHLYAEREGANGKPLWLSGLGAVVYSTFVGEGHELWISWGDPAQAERIAPRVEGLTLAVDPMGLRLLYFPSPTSSQPRLLDVARRVEQPLPLDVARWRYSKYPEPVQSMIGQSVFQVAWSPDGSQLLFYTQPWTFLLDLKTLHVCEMDLGRSGPENMPIWALQATWSPNGRYLAFITTDTFPQAGGTGATILSTDLMILDMRTGDLRTLQPMPGVHLQQHRINDIAWAPDGQNLLVLGQTETVEGRPIQKLHLVDASTGDSRPVLPAYTFGGGAIEGWQLAWSPDGQTIAIKCPVWLETEPTIVEDRICLISITLQP